MTEVEQLRAEVEQLRADLDYARSLLMGHLKRSGDAVIAWDRRQNRRGGAR